MKPPENNSQTASKQPLYFLLVAIFLTNISFILIFKKIYLAYLQTNHPLSDDNIFFTLMVGSLNLILFSLLYEIFRPKYLKERWNNYTKSLLTSKPRSFFYSVINLILFTIKSLLYLIFILTAIIYVLEYHTPIVNSLTGPPQGQASILTSLSPLTPGINMIASIGFIFSTPLFWLLSLSKVNLILLITVLIGLCSIIISRYSKQSLEVKTFIKFTCLLFITIFLAQAVGLSIVAYQNIYMDVSISTPLKFFLMRFLRIIDLQIYFYYAILIVSVDLINLILQANLFKPLKASKSRTTELFGWNALQILFIRALNFITVGFLIIYFLVSLVAKQLGVDHYTYIFGDSAWTSWTLRHNLLYVTRDNMPTTIIHIPSKYTPKSLQSIKYYAWPTDDILIKTRKGTLLLASIYNFSNEATNSAPQQTLLIPLPREISTLQFEINYDQSNKVLVGPSNNQTRTPQPYYLHEFIKPKGNILQYQLYQLAPINYTGLKQTLIILPDLMASNPYLKCQASGLCQVADNFYIKQRPTCALLPPHTQISNSKYTLTFKWTNGKITIYWGPKVKQYLKNMKGDSYLLWNRSARLYSGIVSENKQDTYIYGDTKGLIYQWSPKRAENPPKGGAQPTNIYRN